MRSVESVFRSIYRAKRWGDAETASGTGSKLEQTTNIRDALPLLIRKYHVRTILDIPCGDFNWMKHVDLSGLTYYGADIVRELVDQNNTFFKAPNRTFFHADITTDHLPQVDLVLCRDCLVHFSDKHIRDAIRNIKASSSMYLLTTTFPSHDNRDIITGSWRALNFERAPFSFGDPLEIITEGFHGQDTGVFDKSLALWRIKDLP